MNLRNQTDLANVIEAIFVAACRELGIKPLPTPAAMEPLIAPGRTYARDVLGDIDLNLLYEALHAVAAALIRQQQGSVAARSNRADIERALATSTCHYIWFC